MRVIASTLILTVFLTGCVRGKIRKQIGEDLGLIVQAGDCETTCEKLKEYIANKLSK